MNHDAREPTPRDEEVGRNPESRAELEAIRDAMRPRIQETDAGAPIVADPRGPEGTVDPDWRMNEKGRQLGLQRLREMRAKLDDVPGVAEDRVKRANENIVIEDIPNRPRPEDLEDPEDS